MPYQFPSDVDADVRKYIASGRYGTEDEVLRDALRALRYRNDDILAIQQGIEDMEAGRLISWEDFDRDFRAKRQVTHGA